MIFNKHSEWKDKHATLSASKSAWLRYTDERLFEYVDDLGTAAHGTRLHAYAAMAIKLKQKQPDNSKTVNAYINEAIGYRMEPEQVLFVSPIAFGTADAISFRDGVLRIFDLKTGKNKASGEQLLVYAAYFCLEYGVKPSTIQYDLRIFQHDQEYEIEVDPVAILYIMDRTMQLNKLISDRLNEEV